MEAEANLQTDPHSWFH